MLTLHLSDDLDDMIHKPIELPYPGPNLPEIIQYHGAYYSRYGISEKHAYYKLATVVVI